MKLSLGCTQCIKETNLPQPTLGFAELQDNGIYKVICPKGHETYQLLENQRFELLFESGSLALIAGYPREAVSSIVASFERFIEYYLRIILFAKEINEEEIDKTWKLVANASERQLGGFLFLKVLLDGEAITFDLQSYSTFRNKVIHKGYIPNTEKVINFGQKVLNYMGESLKHLRLNYQTAIDAYRTLTITRIKESAPVGAITSGMGLATIISIHTSIAQFGNIDYRSRLEIMKQFRMHEWVYRDRDAHR